MSQKNKLRKETKFHNFNIGLYLKVSNLKYWKYFFIKNNGTYSSLCTTAYSLLCTVYILEQKDN